MYIDLILVKLRSHDKKDRFKFGFEYLNTDVEVI